MSLRRVISLLCVLLCLGSAVAYGQNVKEKESRKARLEKEIAILDRQIKDNAAKNADALSRLSLVRSKISARQALVRESEREIAALDDSIAVRQRQIDVLQARLDTMILYGQRLVKSAYKNRDARVWYMYILASDNVAQGFRRLSFFKNLSSQMTVQAAKIRAAKAKNEFDKVKVTYDEEYQAAGKELEEMREAAKAKAKGIEPEFMERYETIKRRSVPPLAALYGDQCGGCNMSLPSSVSRRVKAGELVECETCGRLLIIV